MCVPLLARARTARRTSRTASLEESCAGLVGLIEMKTHFKICDERMRSAAAAADEESTGAGKNV